MPVGPETPLTYLADKTVFTADGYRVGRVVDVVIDLEGDGAPALALGDVDEDTVGQLPDDAAGVRIPYRGIRGVEDAVVLRWRIADAARSLDSAPGSGPDGDDRDAAGNGDDVDGDVVV
ncbi:PRC-barrel domain-containing protein [Halobaculum sp. D14]|uniref:PRC-barrel domain-containing protein n=1 Tax=Halobaculum sp. D14 TaxID=3421642 RepID=UPI003EBA5CB2